MLKELIGYLDLPDSDYWYDHGCNVARSIIDTSIDDFMKKLSNEWSAWPLMRQEHLAYILGESNSASELSLINEMLKSVSPDDVVYRAKEALDDYNQNT